LAFFSSYILYPFNHPLHYSTKTAEEQHLCRDFYLSVYFIKVNFAALEIISLILGVAH